MSGVLDQIGEWRARGDRVVLAMVVGSSGSAPRALGSKMAINQRGEIAGGVSGGCVEAAVIETAGEILEGASPQLLRFDGTGHEIGDTLLPCGGSIDVWIQISESSTFEERARAGARVAEVTLLSGSQPGAKLVIEADRQASGSLGDPGLDRQATCAAHELLASNRPARIGSLFIDVVPIAPRLVVVGAVDVAASLCALASAIGWQVYVVDPRATFATRRSFPGASDVIVAWPRDAFAKLGSLHETTSVAVVSHDQKIDDEALLAALRSHATFIGAMGSRTAHTHRQQRLRFAGLPDDALRRLAAPLGLDLGASTTEETALSILAEVVAAHHGRPGGPLTRTHGPIHNTRSRPTVEADPDARSSRLGRGR